MGGRGGNGNLASLTVDSGTLMGNFSAEGSSLFVTLDVACSSGELRARSWATDQSSAQGPSLHAKDDHCCSLTLWGLFVPDICQARKSGL